MNFIPPSEQGRSLVALHLEDLQRGNNTHYTSKRFKQGLTETVAKLNQENIRMSPPFLSLY